MSERASAPLNVSGLGRRTFLIGSAVAAAGVGLAAPAGAAVSRRLGGVEVIALLDTAGPFPGTRQFAFPNATDADWAAARRIDPGAFGTDNEWRLNFQCYLIRRPEGAVTLVDTGVGPVDGPAPWAPVPGRLLQRLTEARVRVSDVDTVVLTHLHEDHYGGSVTPAGVPVFPNARYVVQRTEVDNLPAGDLALTYAVEPLRRTGQLHVVDGRTRLHACREAVFAVPTPGHTVGHQSVTVEGPHGQIVITGDVLVHAVQLANPDVLYHFEADKPLAARTRRELIDSARQHRALLATAHLTRPFVTPG